MNDFTMMDVDDTTDAPKKPNLNARLQQKQFEMDWEDVSWTRSVCKLGTGMRVTVHF